MRKSAIIICILLLIIGAGLAAYGVFIANDLLFIMPGEILLGLGGLGAMVFMLLGLSRRIGLFFGRGKKETMERLNKLRGLSVYIEGVKWDETRRHIDTHFENASDGGKNAIVLSLSIVNLVNALIALGVRIVNSEANSDYRITISAGDSAPVAYLIQPVKSETMLSNAKCYGSADNAHYEAINLLCIMVEMKNV